MSFTNKISTRFLKDIYLGLCFFMLFNGYKSLKSVEKTILVSMKKDNPSLYINGYVSFGILYTSLSFGFWFAPGIIAKTGAKYAMVTGASFYLLFFASYYTEDSFWIYLGAALCGFGASILWIGQANYTVLNSEIGKTYSGIGVFWILFESSNFLGNLILYFLFNNEDQTLDRSIRVKVILLMVGFAVIAILMMLAIQPPLRNDEDAKIVRSLIGEMLKSVKLLFTRRLLLLTSTMIHLGFNLTFLITLSAGMSFSRYLSANSKELAPISGIFQGFGEIFGGFLTIFIGNKRIFNLKPLITIAFLSLLIGYVIAFLMLPRAATRSNTDDLPILVLSKWLLVFGALMAAFGGTCLQTETFDYVGTVYPNDSSSAYAVVKFISSVATAISFYCVGLFDLYTLLTILLGFNFLSWISFNYLQWAYDQPHETNADNNDQTEMKTNT